VIDFRYHVVSIAAVFLSLALGLFIGSTTLRGKVAADLESRTNSVASSNRDLHTQNKELKSQLAMQQSFDRAVLPYAVRGQLTARSVVVVSAPDVDNDVRGGVIGALTEAGATITGDVRLQSTLLDPEQDQFLTTLTDQLPVPGRIPSEGTGSERALRLLADVLGTRPQNTPIGAAAAGRILAAYENGDLISIDGDEPRAGSLVVLLTPAAPTAPDDTDTAATDLLAGFAADLDHAAVGAVVTGPTAATGDGGLLRAIREDKSVRADVSTVDGAEQPSGLIATVIALVEQDDDRAGSYGLTFDDPLPSPTPS
jgi:hypothetical protein